MIKFGQSLRSSVRVNGVRFKIPYSGSKILAVFELNNLSINFDCRKGTCKSCAVRVTLEGETVETLACMEEAIDGMEISTEGLQEEVQVVVPPMEVKRRTTRKIAAKPQSRAEKANAQVARILQHAQISALDGDWENCANFVVEITEILHQFEKKEDVQSVFMKGSVRDMLRDFLASLRGSTSERCSQASSEFTKEMSDKLT
jgi:ferredoxin